ncbi:MAG: hypothetical protein A3I88_00580 [Candidatus Portnoybacteria bacterium RIFCSPLOWO2_12_FULL_39_9]|uniref:Uncharacterized protein n=1 Tax=Candidatus Portnoybacteria bacterium RIFCSPHIGHO2_12_FULL_38_9 TaxID=1801997 RepID=A0A1G2FHQ2_9BACT|nr:MAG: hypothetical protein A3H00_01050 [Candidatus Portnoybacteria bacterium RBG_13_40_8]OGZ36870.1 MAG: hypothetical protein A2646_00485 [Candidatus Portnoybacteria bacterium RIFCSPHIGHO2_02_FULL_39_12]OGZ37624.1 MAG: hypothetical protein A3J64_02915 [Candidatus Portnoybacteria bacterium RIFCSPHIGHO2_12_FULL_38_9]OGZ39539.1 MAG: hypothetical protein A3F21_03730 [Candidatus Portnoybacteria bacterium RIFCSPLOWO2_01_FULL_38_39]OGZ39623.1 MAG: hypothetical protein A3I88_00580 [Candidatus Portnoy
MRNQRDEGIKAIIIRRLGAFYEKCQEVIVYTVSNNRIICQTVVRQVGPYLPQALILEGSCPLYERIRMDRPLVYQLARPGHGWVAMSGKDKR